MRIVSLIKERKMNSDQCIYLYYCRGWFRPSRYEIILRRTSVKFIFVMIFFDQMNQFFERIVITLGEGYSLQLSDHTSSICIHHQAHPHHFLSGNKTVILSASSLLSPCFSLTLNFSTYHHMNIVTFFYEEKKIRQ